MPDNTTERKPTGSITWEDWRGREQRRPINYIADWRECRHPAGKALMIVGANTHLSLTDIERLLSAEGIERSRSWVNRRRWLFRAAEKVGVSSPANRDGQDARAIAIMARHRTFSVRKLAFVLRDDYRIRRGVDWVRKHRYDAVGTSDWDSTVRSCPNGA
jgi:hypothetical protein